MEYSELMCQVLDAFYKNGRDFPKDMLYPILRYDFNGNIVDMFVACNLVRNTVNGKVLKIERIKEILFNGVKDKKVEFVDVGDSKTDDTFYFAKLDTNVSIKDFTHLYMEIREFVFESKLTKEQKEKTKALLTIYENLFEDEVKGVYHKYGFDFYKWAYQIITEN